MVRPTEHEDPSAPASTGLVRAEPRDLVRKLRCRDGVTAERPKSEPPADGLLWADGFLWADDYDFEDGYVFSNGLTENMSVNSWVQPE